MRSIGLTALALGAVGCGLASLASGLLALDLYLTEPLVSSEAGIRGMATGATVQPPIGPPAVVGVTRVQRCTRMDGDVCVPEAITDLPFGGPLGIRTESGTETVPSGDPYVHWRGQYFGDARVYRSFSALPLDVQAAIPRAPELAWRLQVLSIAPGEDLHVYGEGADLRVVVGSAASEEAEALRVRRRSVALAGTSALAGLSLAASLAMALGLAMLWRRRA